VLRREKSRQQPPEVSAAQTCSSLRQDVESGLMNMKQVTGFIRLDSHASKLSIEVTTAWKAAMLTTIPPSLAGYHRVTCGIQKR